MTGSVCLCGILVYPQSGFKISIKLMFEFSQVSVPMIMSGLVDNCGSIQESAGRLDPPASPPPPPPA